MARSRTLALLAAAPFALLAALALLYRGGSGSIPAPPRVEAAPDAARIEVARVALDRTAAVATRSAIAPPVDWNPGMGPVQLAGRVVDERGVPLAGASVTVAELGADKPEVLSCTTDAEGRFEAHGSWSSPEVIARAMHPECWNSASCRVVRGTAAVELALQHGARLQGRFATERLEPLPDIMLALVNLETKANAGTWLPFLSRPADLAGDGSGSVECTLDGGFTVRGLRPGHYSIEVKASGVASTVASVADIELRAGECWSGAECNPLLLRMPAPVDIEIEVADVRGLGRDDRLHISFDPWLGGERPDPYRLGHHGYRARKAGGGVVTYHSAIVPDPPGTDIVLGEAVHVRLPAAGKFSLLLFVVRKGSPDEGLIYLPVESITPRWIDVTEPVAPARFLIHVDEGQLAALLKQAER